MEGLLASAAGGYLIERITRARFARAWQLRLRYDDKPRISFTDLTSFVVMQETQVPWRHRSGLSEQVNDRLRRLPFPYRPRTFPQSRHTARQRQLPPPTS